MILQAIGRANRIDLSNTGGGPPRQVAARLVSLLLEKHQVKSLRWRIAYTSAQVVPNLSVYRRLLDQATGCDGQQAR